MVAGKPWLMWFKSCGTRALVVFALSWMLVAAMPAGAQTAIPAPDGRVTDAAHVLSRSDREALTALLSDYESETHHQIAVLTVPTVGTEALEVFSLRVANAWGIGLKGWNDGILVTISVRERGIRIDLGEGMERYISNSMARDIIDHDMMPAFRRGDIAGALHAGLLHLMLEGRAYKIADPRRPPPTAYAPHFTAPATVNYCKV